MKQFKLFINNEWVDAEGGKTFVSKNPCTGEENRRTGLCVGSGYAKAIAAAKSSISQVGGARCGERAEIPAQVADILGIPYGEFARWEAMDTGKPIGETRSIGISLAFAHLFPRRQHESTEGKVIPVPDSRCLTIRVTEPPWCGRQHCTVELPLHLLTVRRRGAGG